MLEIAEVQSAALVTDQNAVFWLTNAKIRRFVDITGLHIALLPRFFKSTHGPA